jgi:hypothetical protein
LNGVRYEHKKNFKYIPWSGSRPYTGYNNSICFRHPLRKRGKLFVTDQGLTLDVSGALQGLGNDDAVIKLTAYANVVSVCTNSGGHQAPGQNPALITVRGLTEIPASAIKKMTPFTVETEPPPVEIPGAPDCPNPNWTETIENLYFTSATINVEQPAETTVLTVECSFDPPTTDGSVSRKNYICTQTFP